MPARSPRSHRPSMLFRPTRRTCFSPLATGPLPIASRPPPLSTQPTSPGPVKSATPLRWRAPSRSPPSAPATHSSATVVTDVVECRLRGPVPAYPFGVVRPEALEVGGRNVSVDATYVLISGHASGLHVAGGDLQSEAHRLARLLGLVERFV